jgi:prepilin peptidase CpaA
MTHPIIAYAVVGIACALAAMTDVLQRRIPNVLTGALALAAVALAILSGPASGFAALAVALGVLLFGAVCFALGVLGGGDVKLLAAASLALGYPCAIGFIVATLICGGVLAIGSLIATGRLRAAFTRLRGALLGGGPASIGAGSGHIPYALAIAAGAACSAFGTFGLPFVRIAR